MRGLEKRRLGIERVRESEMGNGKWEIGGGGKRMQFGKRNQRNVGGERGRKGRREKGEGRKEKGFSPAGARAPSAKRWTTK
jgi:hypothetical protein